MLAFRKNWAIISARKSKNRCFVSKMTVFPAGNVFPPSGNIGNGCGIYTQAGRRGLPPAGENGNAAPETSGCAA
mgnify:CR=1 FL=1